jgi:glyoxalase family protein
MHDPDGHIVELATLGPGFAVDEPFESLGESLRIPPWLESSRNRIERALAPVSVDPWDMSEETVETIAG